MAGGQNTQITADCQIPCFRQVPPVRRAGPDSAETGALLYAVMVTTNKRAAHITGLENALLQMLFGFLTVAVFVVIRDRGFAIDVRPGDWAWIVLLGAVNTGTQAGSANRNPTKRGRFGEAARRDE